MTNRFGVLLYRDDVRWAVAEGVSETVIAAVLLLHERSVEEIAPKLSAAELEKVIKLVGRSPGVYPPSTLDVLKQQRALVSPEPPQQSSESTRSEVAAVKRHAGTRGADPRGRSADPRGQPSRDQPAEKRHAVTRGADPRGRSADPRGQPSRDQPAKAGTSAGTRNETARRRVIVEDLMRAGLSIRMMAQVTDIPRSTVHRAMRAVARAEAKKQVAIGEITAELLGKKLSRRRRGRA
jgi:hypothetical protein